MRFKFSAVCFALVLVNFVFIFYLTRKKTPNVERLPPVVGVSEKKGSPEAQITLVFRDFEHFDNDLLETITSLREVLPNVSAIVVSDTVPYPQMRWLAQNGSHAHLLVLQPDLTKGSRDLNILSYLKTKYTMFVPDSVRFLSARFFKNMLNNHVSKTITVAPVSKSSPVSCQQIDVNIREWKIILKTLQHSQICNGYEGRHFILVDTNMLQSFLDPIAQPFPESFYVQAKTKNVKVFSHRVRGVSAGSGIISTDHFRWKYEQALQNRRREFYHRLQMKLVVRDGHHEWYGCNRNTPRCFGTIIGETPSYLWEGRWTPPCCLAGLRVTARYVFKRLREAGVRYWLEGGSLMGAFRHGDILPWDYDVDVGFMRDDLHRLPFLVKAAAGQTVDDQGFSWEKANHGDFYRVQYSSVNHLHVDLFPFYERNGTMTKDTWFATHRQDREFPAHFLKPLSTIRFVDELVSAPNNIHDFLELKFGEGAIENPEYPNPELLRMPEEIRPMVRGDSEKTGDAALDY